MSIDTSLDAGFASVAFPRLNDARQDELDEQSRAQGHAAGYTEGLRAAAVEAARQRADMDAEHAAALVLAEAKVDRAVLLLGAAARALDERSIPLLREAEDTLVMTALELAEAVLGSELSRTEPSARRALQRAIDQQDPLDRTEYHTVRMHPDDLAALGDTAVRLPGVTFVPDSLLRRGDAITEFSDGFLDARIGAAFARAKAALLGDAS